jgi:hypothetical protein
MSTSQDQRWVNLVRDHKADQNVRKFFKAAKILTVGAMVVGAAITGLGTIATLAAVAAKTAVLTKAAVTAGGALTALTAMTAEDYMDRARSRISSRMQNRLQSWAKTCA